jgi:hypothetical protein
MNMTMPILPTEETTREIEKKNELLLLRSQTLTPTSYDLVLKGDGSVIDELPPIAAAAIVRPHSSAECPSKFRGILSSSATRCIPSLVRAPRLESASVRSTKFSILQFEKRAALGALIDISEDSEDKKEEVEYQQRCAVALREESNRIGRISETYAKLASVTIDISKDIAGSERDSLQLFVAVEQLSRSAVFLRMIHKRSLVALMDAAGGSSSVGFKDIAFLFDDVLPAHDISRELRSLVDGAAERVPTATLVAAFRYAICTHRGIPEAPLLLFRELWHLRVDQSVGKMSFLTAIDAYRRRRGFNPEGVQQLLDIAGKIQWGRDQMCPCKVVDDMITDCAPVVDSAMIFMMDHNCSMYQAPLGCC